MKGTFMFECDRFDPEKDYYPIYRTVAAADRVIQSLPDLALLAS